MGTPGAYEQSGIPNIIAPLQLICNTNRATQIDHFVCSRVLVKSSTDNPGRLYVGNVGVVPGGGFELLPGQAVDVHINDSSKIWIASDTDRQLAFVLIEVFGDE
jgi:hypothetical protein